MRELAELLEEAPGVTNAAVYILSDFQRHDWTTAPGTQPESTPGLFAPLQAWAKNERQLSVALIDVRNESPANTAVIDLSVAAGQLVAGTEAAVRTVVGNYGNQAIESVELQATVGNLVQPSETISAIAPGQTATLDVRATFLHSGTDPFSVQVPSDALPIDNERFLAVQVVPAIRILVVNGDPSPDAYDDEVTFLATALRPEGEAFSGNELTIVDESQLAEMDLAPFHMVILANVYRAADPTVEALEQFARSGGGILIFLGDQVVPEIYNASLFRQGAGLLPGSLTERLLPSEPVNLVVVDRLHPALRALSGDRDPLGLGQVPFFSFLGCAPFAGDDFNTDLAIDSPGSSEDSFSSTDSPSTGVEQPANVLVNYDDAEDNPAIIERPYGLGKVLLITSSADKGWNHWPDHPTYLPFLLELTRYAARRSQEGGGHWVGEPIEFSFDPNTHTPDAIIRTPAFPDERESSVTGQPVEGRGLLFRWEHTEQPGFYQLVVRRQDGGESRRIVAVNVDPRESDLTSASEAELRQAAGDLDLIYVRGVQSIASTTAEARTELWRLSLVAALLALFGEQSLAWWWGRRR